MSYQRQKLFEIMSVLTSDGTLSARMKALEPVIAVDYGDLRDVTLDYIEISERVIAVNKEWSNEAEGPVMSFGTIMDLTAEMNQITQDLLELVFPYESGAV